jgi:hypothetical protein
MNIIVDPDQSLAQFLLRNGNLVTDGEKHYLHFEGFFQYTADGLLLLLPTQDVPDSVLEALKLDSVL